MSKLLLKNGRVIDPAGGMDRVTNLLIADGRINAYDAPDDAEAEIIDARDMIVAPGLIDIHVHLREPGFEGDETIATGTAAALAGGFTTVACMPNPNPPLDSPESIALVRQLAQQAGNCNVLVVATATKGRAGKELVDFARLIEAGAIAFSDDGAPVHDAELMCRALEECRTLDKPVLNHAEAPELSKGGVMHDGQVSLRLGLPGIPAAAEEQMIVRDLALAEATGGRLHVMHVSTSGGVEAIRSAKARGARVTAEAAPHHFALDDESLRGLDANFKMNPPLRSREHVAAIIAGLKDGTIDAVASDHAPHSPGKKQRPIAEAPFGVVGLETALGVAATKLVATGELDWPALIRLMSAGPARVLGIDRGTLAIGAAADVTIIDPAARWTVDPSLFRSKSRNTPFAGWELVGRAAATIVGGRVKYRA
jgi:dihydroorotase